MTVEEIYAKCGWDYSKISGSMLSESVTFKLVKEASEHFGNYFLTIKELIWTGEYSEARTIINDILATCDFLGLTPIGSKVEILKRAVSDVQDRSTIMLAFDSAYQQYELMRSLVNNS